MINFSVDKGFEIMCLSCGEKIKMGRDYTNDKLVNENYKIDIYDEIDFGFEMNTFSTIYLVCDKCDNRISFTSFKRLP